MRPIKLCGCLIIGPATKGQGERVGGGMAVTAGRTPPDFSGRANIRVALGLIHRVTKVCAQANGPVPFVPHYATSIVVVSTRKRDRVPWGLLTRIASVNPKAPGPWPPQGTQPLSSLLKIKFKGAQAAEVTGRDKLAIGDRITHLRQDILGLRQGAWA